MRASSNELREFAASVFSQGGEDGIVGEILSRIEAHHALDKWCVEFGALDGIKNSNTCHLVRNRQYRAVLIEADKRRYRQLCDNFPEERVFKLRAFVSFEGDSSLDRILASTDVPRNFDFLSIDVDGCDYHVFASMTMFEPKVVCIEFNHHIPNDVDFVQERSFSVKRGSSARALIRLASARGYFLAAVTQTNLIFVRAEFEGCVGATTLERERDDSEIKTYIFFGYDGTLLSNRKTITIPWHRLTIDTSRMQFVPSSLRKFGEDYGPFERLWFAVFVLLRFPHNFFGLFNEKVVQRWRRRGDG